MLTSSDFLRLPYTPDLTEGGVAYVLRSLPNTFIPQGVSPYNRLRNSVARVAVELAFRRYLANQGVPFEVESAAPFTDPDRYDVSLGGHRCDIKSFVISRRGQIKLLQANPDLLLKVPALVPSDHHTAEDHRGDDLYLFAFLTGLVAASQGDITKALGAGQPIYLVHVLSRDWSKPSTWQPLSPLTLKSESEQTLTVEVSGQAADREFLTRTLELPPLTRVLMDDELYAVSSLQVNQLPGGRIGIHSPYMDDPYIVDPFGWGNICFYGMDIALTGYISYDEFRQRCSQIQPGSRVFQYTRTKTRNLAVPVADLKPLDRLFEQVREWEAGNTRP
jgi:hypothetical protein